MKFNLKILAIFIFLFLASFLFSADTNAQTGDGCITSQDATHEFRCPINGAIMWCRVRQDCEYLHGNFATTNYEPYYYSSVLEFQRRVFDEGQPDGLERTVMALWTDGTSALATMITGPADITVAQQAGIPTGGAIGFLASGISTMTSQRPVRTATYIADIGSQAGLVKTAYAQDGTGFSALQPVLKVWKAFRNISYMAFVIIFIVLGFMIMFRAKIDQQTVISVQLALPKIIITLLLITFSYAIASLVIDLIYLLIYLFIGIFTMFGILDSSSSSSVQGILLGENIFVIAWRYMLSPGDTAGAAARAVSDLVDDVLGDAGAIGDFFGATSSALAYVVFAAAILISVFKLFFQLLMAYIGIIFSVIFAPIILLFNALPGSQSFSKWLKGIVASAMIFPVTAVLLLVSAAMLGETDFGIASDIGFQNNRDSFNQTALPFIGGGIDANSMMGLIGIGFIMMMPKINEMIQKAMGIEGGLAGMAGAIMEPIASGYGAAKKPFAPIGAGAKTLGRYATLGKLGEWSSEGRGDPSLLGKTKQAIHSGLTGVKHS
jgi:hypothetical protein